MTVSNNGKSIALVVLIVILALFAFRSIFFVMPFGIFPGLARSVGDAVIRSGAGSTVSGHSAQLRSSFFPSPSSSSGARSSSGSTGTRKSAG